MFTAARKHKYVRKQTVHSFFKFPGGSQLYKREQPPLSYTENQKTVKKKDDLKINLLDI